MGRLSAGERTYIADGIAQDLRCDGRAREDYRPFTIETGVVSQANGSARVQLGNTDVIATVKAEVGRPADGRPHHGNVFISVECSPTATPDFEGRGGEDMASDLTHAIERCFLGGSSGAGCAVDLAGLCIVRGKLSWALHLDALLLNDDGNVLDALCIALRAALGNTRLPKVDLIKGEGENADEVEDFDISDEESTLLDISNVPAVITLTQVGAHYIVDASGDEEAQMSAAMTVAATGKGSIRGVSKRGARGLDVSVVTDMLSVARRLARRLVLEIDAQLAVSELRHS